jgi:hypothetical protein
VKQLFQYKIASYRMTNQTQIKTPKIITRMRSKKPKKGYALDAKAKISGRVIVTLK